MAARYRHDRDDRDDDEPGSTGPRRTRALPVLLGCAVLALAGLVVVVTRSTDGLIALAAFLTAAAPAVGRMLRR